MREDRQSRWVLGAALVAALLPFACSSAGAPSADPSAGGEGPGSGGTGVGGRGGGSGAVGGSILVTGGASGTSGAGATGGIDDVPPVCGDGLINREGEVCDDGNAHSGDGCTAECN
jgi:cysteine-rich repeat protein